jgi:folate-binding protein YgfZ
MAKIILKTLTLDADALMVRGPDAFAFLQGMFTADIRRGLRGEALIPYGGGSFLLDQKAKVVAPSKYWIFKNQEIIVSLPRGTAELVAAELEKFHVADDLEIVKPEPRPWLAQLIVRAADGVFSFQCPALPGPGEGARDRVFQLDSRDWGFALALPEWGPDFFQLWVNDLKKFEAQFELQPFFEREIAELRMDRGVPTWGIDMDRESFILEYPHGPEISFFKGCYKGQEVVARGTYRGSMPKAFAKFKADPGQSLSVGFVFNSEDPTKPVGKISSVQGGRGLGLVRVAALQSGRLFQLEMPDKRVLINKVEVLIQGRE